VYGDDPLGEAAVGAEAVSNGADCLVIDAEAAYEGRYASARTYTRNPRRTPARLHYMSSRSSRSLVRLGLRSVFQTPRQGRPGDRNRFPGRGVCGLVSSRRVVCRHFPVACDRWAVSGAAFGERPVVKPWSFQPRSRWLSVST
jgi:hypothetical protein